MVITENGIKFTVEDAKSAQAIAYVQSELFREYSLQQDGSVTMFRVNLPVLMVRECNWNTHEGHTHMAPLCMSTCTSTFVWFMILIKGQAC